MSKQSKHWVVRVAGRSIYGLVSTVTLLAGCQAGPPRPEDGARAGVMPLAPPGHGEAIPPPDRAAADPGELALSSENPSQGGEASRAASAERGQAERWARAPRRGAARNAVSHVANTGPTRIPGTVVCAQTRDGFPAYGFNQCSTPFGNNGGFNVYTNDGINTQTSGGNGWAVTNVGYGYQCLEFALRYLYGKYKIVWGADHHVDSAWQMCNTHPNNLTKTTTPTAGDLVVFNHDKCGIGPAGHVAVVDSFSGNLLQVIQQNPAGKVPWRTDQGCIECYLHPLGVLDGGAARAARAR